jgi:hypothetical protein
MSIGSLGIVGGFAGAPLSQAKSAEAEKNREAAAQQAQVRADERAEASSGIGRADGENHESHDRDADGRLGYFQQPTANPEEQNSVEGPGDDNVLHAPPQAVDPNGVSGSRLDLTG